MPRDIPEVRLVGGRYNEFVVYNVNRVGWMEPTAAVPRYTHPERLPAKPLRFGGAFVFVVRVRYLEAHGVPGAETPDS